MNHIIILLLVLLVANLPWLSNRFFYAFGFKNNHKNLAWCLFELIVLYFAVGFIIKYAEYSLLGQNAPQGWEFYTVTACMFLVFAFPGFIYKILWKK
jgi:Na+(H+)/acetate symporter ActP